MSDSVAKASPSSVSTRLAKPLLRGHLKNYLQRHLSIAAALSLGAAFAWKYGVAEPRKRRYAEFYRNYDAEADFERMDKLGLFHYFEEIEADED
ncbi:Cytochrome c oxidase subunit 6C [Halotydeus destructor]|nr:Cytochrome c oxidase subunit 6C [Halotydeus destructor]